MNRREALKHLGLSFGIALTGPGLLSFAKGRSTSNIRENYFFSEKHIELLTKVVDIILPGTNELPSASKAGVPAFIDQYVAEVVDENEQKRISEYMNRLSAKADTSDLGRLVDQSFNLPGERQGAIWGEINSYTEAVNSGTAADLSDDAAIFALMYNLRSLTIEAYKSSRLIGETVLAYDPVPGRQQGCVDLQETTGGRAWSM